MYLVLTFVAAVAGFSAASAPSDPAPSVEPIEVIGQTPDEIRRRASNYVRELGVASTQRQAARWFDPVCPRVAGIDDRYAAVVENHIRGVARSVGAPLAPPGCRANFAIIFTDDAPAVMKKIDGIRLREVPTRLVPRLRRGSDPVRWWYTTTGITRAQIPVSGVTDVRGEPPPSKDGMARGAGGGLPSNHSTTYTREDRFSRLSTQTMRSLESATVIIQADGRPLEALAAYAAFVGLAEVSPEADPTGSILSLFNRGTYVHELTGSDRAFLMALYRLQMDQRGEQQRRELIEGIVNARLPKGARVGGQ